MGDEEFVPMSEIVLAETPPETWGNTILYRLAVALDYTQDNDGTITIDPDEVLQEAIQAIERWENPDLGFDGYP